MDVPCIHGSNCAWLNAIKEITNIDYVPNELCDILYEAHNIFNRKKQTRYTEGDIINAITERHLSLLREIRKIEISFKEMKLDLITIFKNIYHGNSNLDDTIALLKKTMEQNKAITVLCDNTCKKAHSDHTSLMDGIKNDEPIYSRLNARTRPKKRERTCSIVECPIPSNDANRKQIKLQLNDSVDLIKTCSHVNCIWSNAWKYLQMKCCLVGLYNAIPNKCCDAFRKCSILLNKSY